MEHGAGFDPDKVVDVSAMRTAPAPSSTTSRTRDRVSTEGDRDAWPPKTTQSATWPSAKRKGHRPGGFGLLLTSKMVDEVHFNEFGNEVFLVKHLDQHSADDWHLTAKVALITGGKRIGAVVATTLAEAPALTWRWSTTTRARRRKHGRGGSQALAAGPMSVQADVSSEHDCAQAVETTVGAAWPARHPDQHGVALRVEAVRPADRRRLGSADVGGPARDVPVFARGRDR